VEIDFGDGFSQGGAAAPPYRPRRWVYCYRNGFIAIVLTWKKLDGDGCSLSVNMVYPPLLNGWKTRGLAVTFHGSSGH
jgi:hypothetical protein